MEETVFGAFSCGSVLTKEYFIMGAFCLRNMYIFSWERFVLGAFYSGDFLSQGILLVLGTF